MTASRKRRERQVTLGTVVDQSFRKRINVARCKHDLNLREFVAMLLDFFEGYFRDHPEFSISDYSKGRRNTEDSS